MNKKMLLFGGVGTATVKITQDPQDVPPGYKPWSSVDLVDTKFDAIEAQSANAAARAMHDLVRLEYPKALTVHVQITMRDGRPYTGHQPTRWQR